MTDDAAGRVPGERWVVLRRGRYDVLVWDTFTERDTGKVSYGENVIGSVYTAADAALLAHGAADIARLRSALETLVTTVRTDEVNRGLSGPTRRALADADAALAAVRGRPGGGGE